MIIPEYLVKILKSCIENKMVLDPEDTSRGDRGYAKMQVDVGVPQGPVHGPALWNVFYDYLLRLLLSLPEVPVVDTFTTKCGYDGLLDGEV